MEDSSARAIADFDLRILEGNKNREVKPGGSLAYIIMVTPKNGFNSAVSLACAGLPVGASGSFAPAVITPTDNTPVCSTLTVATSSSTPRGKLVITGSSGSVEHSGKAKLALSVDSTDWSGWIPLLILSLPAIGKWAFDSNLMPHGWALRFKNIADGVYNFYLYALAVGGLCIGVYLLVQWLRKRRATVMVGAAMGTPVAPQQVKLTPPPQPTHVATPPHTSETAGPALSHSERAGIFLVLGLFFSIVSAWALKRIFSSEITASNESFAESIATVFLRTGLVAWVVTSLFPKRWRTTSKTCMTTLIVYTAVLAFFTGIFIWNPK